MTYELSPCDNCKRNEIEPTSEEGHITSDIAANGLQLFCQMSKNVVEATGYTYMSLRHEAPQATPEETEAVLKCAGRIAYGGGLPCEKWTYDEDDNHIVPRPAEEE